MESPTSPGGARVFPGAVDVTEPHAELLERVTAVGERLRAAFDALHASIFEGPLGPKRSAERLGEPVPMASRLLRALGAERPIECVLRIPGPDPLQRWVRAARRRGADPAAVRQALAAVQDFERLIVEEAGDRARLDALLSHWVPDVRRAMELRRRQAVFRGQSELKGMSSDLVMTSLLLYPSADGRSVDLCCIQMGAGVVALRPGVRIRFATERDLAASPERVPTCLDGRPSLESLDGVRLDEFCPDLPAQLHTDRIGDRVQYSLEVQGVGPNQPGGIVIVEVNRAAFETAGAADPRYYFHLQAEPTRHILLDVILHEDLVPESPPEVLAYDCIGIGAASAGDPIRELDRMDLDIELQEFAQPLSQLTAPGLPRYRELLAHVTQRLGWSERLGRSYRAELAYPTPGTQLMLAFNRESRGRQSGAR